jgi:AcrR family transcriptional regulator
MLNACAELLEEDGYEALSTTRIAERAGVAIGSLYQFFPDKRAIAQALTQRHLDLFTRRLGERFADAPFTSWWDAVDAVFDVYVEMHRGTRGFRVLHFGDVVDMHLLDSAADNNTVVLDRLRDLLVDRLGVASGPDLDRVLAVAIEAGDAALKLAFRADPDGDPVLLNEGKLLVHRYLAGHFATES